MNNFKKGFTLAEVLITLTILGIVAVITVPALIQRNVEKTTVTKVVKLYSSLINAYEILLVTDGYPNTWKIGRAQTIEGARNIYEKFKPYLNIIKECEANDNDCKVDEYKNLTGDNAGGWSTVGKDSYRFRVKTKDGMIMTFYNESTGCRDDGLCGNIYVDVNGKKGPNRLGVDFFQIFVIKSNGRTQQLSRCVYNDRDTQANGADCAFWIINKRNMDYLRRDISSEFLIPQEW